jgi:hypothetical protein
MISGWFATTPRNSIKSKKQFSCKNQPSSTILLQLTPFKTSHCFKGSSKIRSQKINIRKKLKLQRTNPWAILSIRYQAPNLFKLSRFLNSLIFQMELILGYLKMRKRKNCTPTLNKSLKVLSTSKAKILFTETSSFPIYFWLHLKHAKSVILALPPSFQPSIFMFNDSQI